MGKHTIHKALIVATLSCYISLSGFHSLSEMVSYIQQVPEYPDSDMQDFHGNHLGYVLIQRDIWFETQGSKVQPFDNIIDPSYINFYNALKPTWWQRILHGLGFKTTLQHLWSPIDLKNALKQHNQNNYGGKASANELQMLGMRYNKDIQFFICGNLSGSLHSLVRILQHLALTGDMSDTLKLLRNDTHIVFLGNILGSSPYCAEVLTIVLNLIAQNPNRVWSICGWSEIKQRWRASPLLSELRIRGNLSDNEVETYAELIHDAFLKFPRSIIIADEKNRFLKLTAHTLVTESISQQTAAYVPQLTDQITWHNIYEEASIHHKLTTTAQCCAIIETRRHWDTVWPIEPLTMTTTDRHEAGCIWDLVSGQTRTLRQTYRLQWEAYCVVTLSANIEKSTLKLITRRVDQPDEFRFRQQYQLCTGEIITN